MTRISYFIAASALIGLPLAQAASGGDKATKDCWDKTQDVAQAYFQKVVGSRVKTTGSSTAAIDILHKMEQREPFVAGFTLLGRDGTLMNLNVQGKIDAAGRCHIQSVNSEIGGVGKPIPACAVPSSGAEDFSAGKPSH
jgi:hypothetical protein